MTSLDRRRFLKLATATAGAAALGGIAPTAILRALSIPANHRTGSIEDVEHVVILMQENRSFDHYFGRLRGVRGFGDPRPVTLPGGQSVWHQPIGIGQSLLPFRPDVDHLGLQFIEDLPHGWNDTHAALAGGANNGWVPAKGSTCMAYLQREDIPFHYALADAFTICDAYHCAIPSSTNPNRYYLWSGCAGNLGEGGGPALDNAGTDYRWTTYPERLEQAGVSWKIYQDIGEGLDEAGSWGWTKDPYLGNYGDNSLLYFRQYQQARPGQPLYDKARTGTAIKAAGGEPARLFDQLRADVAQGSLPKVSWIVAPEAYTEHPSWPANYGAWYVSQVLEALTADPELWSKTALFLTYDENDGFFDHVTPPFAPGSRTQGLSTVDTVHEPYAGGGGFVPGNYGLGPRVPMLVISPWSRGGWVCSQTFDHTSIIRFLETRFGVHEPNITPWRRAVCGDLTTAFDFRNPNARVPTLPDTRAWMPHHHPRDSYHPEPPAEQQLPAQEPGLRPARPLPYAFDVDGRMDVNAGRYWLDFRNEGAAGVSLLVLSGNRSDGPWSYTVEPGKQLSDHWSSAFSQDVYDLSVHGPNGFLRQFRGRQRSPADTGPAPEVRADTRGEGFARQLVITLSNPGRQACQFRVQAHDYLDVPERHYTVPAGATVDDIWNLERSEYWYDLIVSVDEDPWFRRRLAGHLETGHASISDPAFGRMS